MSKQSECFNTDKPSNAEVDAIKHLSDGTASEFEQRLALMFIIDKLARANDCLYIAGATASDTAFLNGRAFIGQQLLKILKIRKGEIHTIEKITKQSEEED